MKPMNWARDWSARFGRGLAATVWLWAVHNVLVEMSFSDLLWGARLLLGAVLVGFGYFLGVWLVPAPRRASWVPVAAGVLLLATGLGWTG